MLVKQVTNEKEYSDAVEVRRKVFIEEQRVPEELELDEFEDSAVHFVAYEDGVPVGAGRFRQVDRCGKVERICVLASHRKKGFGEAVMKAIETYASAERLDGLKLNAQTQAASFYERLGYVKTSDEVFLDAGIPHLAMKKLLSP
ncbi:MAG TPA: GNAT family N-acetyltransferase [Bacillales bacterium]|nr:GNAT family N-acetyltransferase [Bacillales bacterium]